MIHGTAEELRGKPVPLSQGSPLISQGKALHLSFTYFLVARRQVCRD
jgi:hypothetical protein